MTLILLISGNAVACSLAIVAIFAFAVIIKPKKKS